MGTSRLTAAQALVRYLCAQHVEWNGETVAMFAGVFAIFGHGNVAGLGEALHEARETLPTYRGHNEQAMAHSAIAFAKATRRRRMMVCASSIGPGATNMVTAAALAHVNRLPVMFLPGDVFANRRPDPVLQQIEDFADRTVSANDCFRPVSRFWDRISRAEQVMASLSEACRVLTDPVNCGPVTLAFPQDVQTEAYDYPDSFFRRRVRRLRRPGPDAGELRAAVDVLAASENPLIIAGGGVHYSLASELLREFANKRRIPVAETQAGKGTVPWDEACAVGAIGVTGSSVANTLARNADTVIAIGTRLQDFTTASRSLFSHPDLNIVHLNVSPFDAEKHGAQPLVADAGRGIAALDEALGSWRARENWSRQVTELKSAWDGVVDRVTASSNAPLPSDAQVLGAVNRFCRPEDIVVCAAGGLPGELHKLWRTSDRDGYHVEYGYSCMGYEIAGGLGVKMAFSEREVYVLLGDGSYLMMNSEIATSVMLGLKLTIVVLDNRGFGCIDRLQNACGGASFNNLFADTRHLTANPVDFAAHAASLGAESKKVTGIAELQQALERARNCARTYVIAIETDPASSTEEGGAWWDVAVPEVSERSEVRQARDTYVARTRDQRVDS